MSRKGNTIESYFKKINPQISENSNKCDKAVETCNPNSGQNSSANKSTMLRESNKKKTISPDFSDDDITYQDSQLCEMLDNSAPESKPSSSTSTNTPLIKGTMFGFTLGQNKKHNSTSSKNDNNDNLIKSSANSPYQTPKSKFPYENKQKTNYYDSSRHTKPPQTSAENEYIGTQLKSSSRHKVLIDTNVRIL